MSINFPPHFVVDAALYGHYRLMPALQLPVHSNHSSQRSQGLFVVVARLIVCSISMNEQDQMVVECSLMLLTNEFVEEVC
jgi:hypothetical protein